MKATSEVSDALVISVLSLSPAERCHCSIYPRRYQCIGTLSRDSDKDDRGKVLMKSNFVSFKLLPIISKFSVSHCIIDI